MSYDTMVERNVYWFGDRKITLEPGEDLAEQVAEQVAERLRADEQDTVRADNGAQEWDVVVSVRLVPRDQRSVTVDPATGGKVIDLMDALKHALSEEAR